MRVIFQKYVGDSDPFLTDIMTGFKMKAALSVPANKVKTKAVANTKAIQNTRQDSQRYMNSIKVTFTEDSSYYKGSRRSVALIQSGKGLSPTGKNSTFHLAVYMEHLYSIMKRAAGAAK